MSERTRQEARILVINPNTDAQMTGRVVDALNGFLPADVALVAATGRFGFPYIATRPAYAVGGHAALEVLARHGAERFDAVMLACFGDPALKALRELTPLPVIGMAEASCLAAADEEGPFAIVTGGAGWQDMLAEFVAMLGLSDRLAAVRTTTLTGGEIMQAPERAIDFLAAEIAACAKDGARRVILGGAGLAGLAQRLRPSAAIPVLDCIEVMAKRTMAMIGEARSAGSLPTLSADAAALVRQGWL